MRVTMHTLAVLRPMEELGHPDVLVDRVWISSIHLGSWYVHHDCTIRKRTLSWSSRTRWKLRKPARSRASSTCWRRRRTRYLRVHMDYQQYVNHHTKTVHATSSDQYMGAVSWTLSVIQQFPFTHTRIYFSLYIHVTNPSPVSPICIHFDLHIHLHI